MPCVCGGLGITLMVDRLLKGEDVNYGIEAIQALMLRPYTGSSDQLRT